MCVGAWECVGKTSFWVFFHSWVVSLVFFSF